MFKYSFEALEKVWDIMSEFWDELPSTSPNKKIEKFHEVEEKIIVNFIKKHSDNPLILDLGCGTGRYLKRLYKDGFRKLYGIDISTKMLKKCKSSLPNSTVLLHHDFRERLPFESNLFDLVLFTGNTLTSGGLVESDVALKQTHRVLKKNGFLIVGNYNAKFMTENFVRDYYSKFPKKLKFERFDKSNKTIYFGKILHSHWLTESELKKLIENVGFKIVSIQKRGIGLIAVAKKRSD